MIQHSVVFRLKYHLGSTEEKVFLSEVEKLASIFGVKNFECLRQTSKKNNFAYGLFMEFDTLKIYETYNQDPDHFSFVKNFWLNYVENFLELDFEQ